ncbi:hypothetical protein ACN38_g11154 [Penicillium nordicum]|uniref:Uncharacterized protein n=1 Tax=Penicillium nordicum TaxID=229535 RepID=A0A0M8NVA0_9EURO|nr:hypothetical protein ACN38_g11154 [Penicillium nordicum]
MATPAAVACNQVESRHATRTIKDILSLECFKAAWKHGKRTLEIAKDPRLIRTVLSGPPQQMSYAGLAEVALFALGFETIQWQCGNSSQPPMSESSFMLVQ